MEPDSPTVTSTVVSPMLAGSGLTAATQSDRSQSGCRANGTTEAGQDQRFHQELLENITAACPQSLP